MPHVSACRRTRSFHEVPLTRFVSPLRRFFRGLPETSRDPVSIKIILPSVRPSVAQEHRVFSHTSMRPLAIRNRLSPGSPCRHKYSPASSLISRSEPEISCHPLASMPLNRGNLPRDRLGLSGSMAMRICSRADGRKNWWDGNFFI